MRDDRVGKRESDLYLGMIRIRHALEPEQQRSRYEALHALGTLHRPARFWRWLADEMGAEPGMCVLDVACGTGAMSAQLEKHGVAVWGTDFSIRALHDTAGGARVVCADGQSLPFPNASFDWVTNIGSLEHFVSPLAGLLEMRRVLHPEGRVLLLLPNSMGFRSCVLSGWRHGEVIDDGQPIQRYGTRAQWSRLLNTAGFQVERVLGCDSLMPRPGSLLKWWQWVCHPSRFLSLGERFLPANLSVELVFICRRASEDPSSLEPVY